MIDIQAQDCWKIATTFQSQIQNKATGTILWHHHGNIQVPESLSHLQILPIGVYWIKEMFNDSSNIFLWHESVDTKKKLISEISVDSKFTFTSYVWLCVLHCSIDCCVEIIIVYDNLFEKCSHFLMKWFQLNSFEEMCFLWESYIQMQQIWEYPLNVISEYTFKCRKKRSLHLTLSKQLINLKTEKCIFISWMVSDINTWSGQWY